MTFRQQREQRLRFIGIHGITLILMELDINPLVVQYTGDRTYKGENGLHAVFGPTG